MTGTMDCYGITHRGLVRENNEDHFLIADLKKSVVIHHTSLSYRDETELHGMSQARVLLVADGVGGSAAGERASSLAIESTIQYLLNAMHWLFRMDGDREEQFMDDLKTAMAFSQKQIQHAAEGAPSHSGMATTLTMAYIAWPTAYFVHIGDTRAYLYRNSELIQVTHDQTIAQMLADVGTISAEEVEHHPFRHVLGSLLGCDPDQLEPAVFKTQLNFGDQLLLCTDGLTCHLGNDDIVDVLTSAASAEGACRQMVGMANNAGGRDNITVLLARFSGSTPDGRADEALVTEGLKVTG